MFDLVDFVFGFLNGLYQRLAEIFKWRSLTQMERAQTIIVWFCVLLFIFFVLYLSFSSLISEQIGKMAVWLARKAAE